MPQPSGGISDRRDYADYIGHSALLTHVQITVAHEGQRPVRAESHYAVEHMAIVGYTCQHYIATAQPFVTHRREHNFVGIRLQRRPHAAAAHSHSHFGTTTYCTADSFENLVIGFRHGGREVIYYRKAFGHLVTAG